MGKKCVAAATWTMAVVLMSESHLYSGSAFCTILFFDIRELDFAAAIAAVDVATAAAAAPEEAAVSAAGLSSARRRSNRCFMTKLRTCETNFPKICSGTRGILSGNM